MHDLKKQRATALYNGHKGATTVAHVLSTIPDELISSLTSRQLAAVMSIRNSAYHEGRASAGAQVDGDAVWIDAVNKLIPLRVLKALTITREGDQIRYSVSASSTSWPYGVLSRLSATRNLYL